MSKKIASPVKKFAGFVELREPLPYPAVLKYERASRSFKKESDDLGEVFLPAILESVESWNLMGVPEKPTPETFPGTPRPEVNRLLAWLLNEITALYLGNEDNDPNG